MKKLLFSAVFLFAIASYGGKNVMTAHAATLSPQQNAALEQTLEVLKAKLVNMQMQAGQIPQGDNGTASAATVTPSVTQNPVSQNNAAISNSLAALTSALSSLTVTLSQHPEMVASHQQAITAVLSGMQSTLASLGNTLNGSGIAARTVTPGQSGNSVATKPTPAPVAVATPPAQTQTPAPTTAANVTPATTQNAPQTANVLSSSWNFVKSHWPTFTIILLVIAILAILFWPQKEEGSQVSRGPAKPVQPSKVAVVEHPANNVNVSVSSPTGASTPVSTVVATPTQRVEVQTMKPKKPAF